MRRSLLARFLVVAALGWLVLLPMQAAAFPSTGPCSLTLISNNALGEVLDTVQTGDDSASAQDPFLVDWEGTVGWEAVVAAPLQDYHFEVDMFGIPTPLQGGSANTADTRSSTGAFAFTGSAAFRFTGLYYLTARISGSGAECEGELVVQLIGDPVGTIPFFVALGLIAIGLLLVVWGAKGHLLAGIFGGIFLGLGVSITLVIFSLLPFGAVTPVAVAVVGVLTGLFSSSVGRARLALASRSAAVSEPEVPADGPEPLTAVPDEVTDDATAGTSAPSFAQSEPPEAHETPGPGAGAAQPDEGAAQPDEGMAPPDEGMAAPPEERRPQPEEAPAQPGDGSSSPGEGSGAGPS